MPEARVRWPERIDAAIDALVVAFAAWTVLYEIALLTQRSIRWAGWPWLVLTTLGVAIAARNGWRRHGRHVLVPPELGAAAGSTSVRGAGSAEPGRAGLWSLLVTVVLVTAVVARGRLGLAAMAIVAVLAIAAQLVRIWHSGAASDDRRRAPLEPGLAAPIEHVLAGVGALGLAVLGSLLLKPDADDAYYLNRATWIAQHGVPVTKDTMYGAAHLPSTIEVGLPTSSVEALQGSLAAALHLSAATVAYVLWVPVMSFVLGWAMWRLVRAWAPRRRLLAYALAVLFLLASAATITGNYSIGRLWQGKVVAVAVLLPLIWVYLSRLARGGGASIQLMLGCAGVAFVGLTTSSALLAPVVVAAALVAALALRSRPLLVGALALLAAPLVNGIVEKFGPAVVNQTGAGAASPDLVFVMAFGSGGMALLAVLALVLAPQVIQGPAAAVAAGMALVTAAMFLPGVLGLANALTAAGPVIWRLAMAAPLPVLVGLLASLRVPPLPDLAGGAVATAAVLATALFSGTWLWSSAANAQLTSHPTWKVDQLSLADVRAAQRLSVPPGLWLLPESQMTVMAISTVDHFPVVPRDYYLSTLPVSVSELQERSDLLRLVRGQPVTPARVGRALRSLEVSLACVPTVFGGAQQTLEQAVGAPLQTVGSMRCHVGRI